ncbi:uroporphyrinogen decarboxylase [Benzoatithermus flavus]|uniref:Uroporphyrinogen decarboxylase n=1 Tax=Benzoatithermus flavus TaxID=3108223 RepID=A0ABU8XW54_9PROT
MAASGDSTPTRKALLAALAGEKRARPPVWLMRQAGRYLPEYRAVRAQVGSFLELCYTPELAVEVTLQPIRRYGLDAAILFSDILVVPDALGAEVRFVEGEGPQLTPLRDEAALARLGLARFHEHLAPVYETVRRLAAALPREVTLIGFSGAPWTLAAYMVEGSGSKEFFATRRLARQEPRLFARLIDLLIEAVVLYLERQIEAGAEALQLFDSWAGVLPEPELRRWCIEPTRRIVEALRARHPEVPVIAFPRGIGASYLSFAREVPVQGLSLDTTVPVAWAARELRSDPPLCLQGNLDPAALLGNPDDLVREAERIVAAYGDRPFVFNLGHGVSQETPPEAVARLVDYLKSTGGCAIE